MLTSMFGNHDALPFQQVCSRLASVQLSMVTEIYAPSIDRMQIVAGLHDVQGCGSITTAALIACTYPTVLSPRGWLCLHASTHDIEGNPLVQDNIKLATSSLGKLPIKIVKLSTLIFAVFPRYHFYC